MHRCKAYPAYDTNCILLACSIAALFTLISFHISVLSPDVYPIRFFNTTLPAKLCIGSNPS